MPTVDLSELDRLAKAFADAGKALPDLRRKAMEECAEKMQAAVRAGIDRSGVQDSRGRVKRWQERYVGSGGGYAAIRPTDAESGPNSPGAITNYLEGGHKNRLPTGRSKRYRPKINKARTPGHYFYQNAQQEAEKIAKEVVEKLASEILERLEGRG